MPLRRAAVAALAACALLVPTGAASAATLTITDPGADDVWLHSWVANPDGPASEQWDAAGSVANVDVTRTKITHGAKAVSLKVSYADLDKSSDRDPTHLAVLKLDKDQYVAWWVWRYGGKTYLQLVSAKRDFARGGSIKCPGLTAKFHWDTDTLTSSFPTSCIGDPDSFRYRGEATAQDPGSDPDDPMYMDFVDTAGHTRGFSDAIKAG